ncbi:5-formyltetrahydrofolate cyclo-ligase [Intestinimonas timonensis]|uniref:5-formyltetrahydrofolate cyclo-ligase n=1 Tax=Intestinimonas timonensis TaxID=1689270 RepID=UPI0010319DDC|nr:5-formyltetrahydrofolate cyclo-ligase [Intestinimonas timonensis]
MVSCTGAKAALRRTVRAQAAAMTANQRRESDEPLFRRFLALPWTAEAETLLLFYGVGTEPDTGRLLPELWRLGKRVCLPKCLPGRAMEARLVRSGDDLRPGVFGIPEPLDACPTVDKREIDLILVPALCYDLSCRRLGQGGGYYDRYLADYGGRTVGLCREGLLQKELPVEEHDRAVDLVLTEKRGLEGPSHILTNRR